MSRPKKEFIPTSLSDLNIDSISLGSNGDRHNNNGSNGARINNLDRSKATSSFNLASHQSSRQSTHSSNSSFSRTSKMYGSQSNLSVSASVNSKNINSPSSGTVDRWEQAWNDNNNTYRPPSFQQQQQREHSIEKPNKSIKHSHTTSFDFKRSNSINQNQPTSNRSSNQNHYVADPFDDPWSGIFICYSSSAQLHPRKVTCRHQHHHHNVVMETHTNESTHEQKCFLSVCHPPCCFSVSIICFAFVIKLFFIDFHLKCVTIFYAYLDLSFFIVKPTISNPIPMSAPQQTTSVNLINNFNNNYRNQTSGFAHCVAIYDFEAENPGELSFKVSVWFVWYDVGCHLIALQS